MLIRLFFRAPLGPLGRVHLMHIALLGMLAPAFAQEASSVPAAAPATPATPAAPATPSTPAAAATPSTPAVPKTVTAVAEPIQSEVSISGTFVAKQVQEIAVATKRIQPLVVAQVAEHGQRVQKGDVILRFETTKLDEMLADQEAAVELSELALKEAESELRIAMERDPLSKEQTELTKRYADEDFKRFQEVDHPFALRAVDQNLKLARQNLGYTEEELKQLEQMYKADDLTEQTEEIILQRARNDVDRSRFFFEQSEKDHEKSTKFTLPRSAQQRQTEHRLAELAYQQTVVSQSVEIDKQRIAVEKTRLEQQRSSKALAELRQDRKLMTVKAPIAGVVYYGRATDGKWTSVTELAKRLAPHGTIAPHEVVLTVVDNQSLEFLGRVPEAELAALHQGTSGRVTPTAYPKERLTARIQQAGDVPIAEGQYEVKVDIDTTPQQRLVAGMTGVAKFTTYVNAKAVVVPAKVVFTEPGDDTRKYVYVLGSSGRGERRDCSLGISVGDRVEIVSGVVAGEQLLEEKPAL